MSDIVVEMNSTRCYSLKKNCSDWIIQIIFMALISIGLIATILIYFSSIRASVTYLFGLGGDDKEER